MIIAERKPIDEIYAMLEPFDKVLVVGCGGCVTVCLTGGERSVEVLAEQLRLKNNLEGAPTPLPNALSPGSATPNTWRLFATRPPKPT